ncbi:MAG: 50S ribosomal protein L34e [Candidatus Bathyarchaeota archaeon]|nr:50S ribosomal protein L34e [Candidatus Bathyarchaeota archaeon]
MPQPHLRTRNLKKVKVKVPGGSTKTHYKKGRVSVAICAVCKKPLAGVPFKDTAEVRKLSYSARRVWRPYGGHVCPSCLKIGIKKAARAIAS